MTTDANVSNWNTIHVHEGAKVEFRRHPSMSPEHSVIIDLGETTIFFALPTFRKLLLEARIMEEDIQREEKEIAKGDDDE